MDIDEPKLEAPLLSLYGDLWTQLLDLLDLTAVTCLLLTGCTPLRANLARNLKLIEHQNVDPVLDFNAILRTCQSLSLVESITILPGTFQPLVRYPIQLDNMPSKLRSLNLAFNTVCTLFSGFDFASHTPSLTNLSLVGASTDHMPLADFLLLPPTLEALTLVPKAAKIIMSPKDFAKLPVSLTSLTIHMCWINEENTRYTWPLSLASLYLSGWDGTVNLEWLPRTLTSLDVSALFGLSTNYTQRMEFKIFPYRLFFPRLTELIFPSYFSVEADSILRSIVAPEASEIEQAQSFISSGFWNIDALKTASTPTTDDLVAYPRITRLSLPFSFWQQPHRKTVAQLQAVAPYIKNTDFIGMTADYSLLEHAGATSKLESPISNQKPIVFPTTLTSLSTTAIQLTELPPTLKQLKCYHLTGQLDDCAECRSAKPHSTASPRVPIDKSTSYHHHTQRTARKLQALEFDRY